MAYAGVSGRAASAYAAEMRVSNGRGNTVMYGGPSVSALGAASGYQTKLGSSWTAQDFSKYLDVVRGADDGIRQVCEMIWSGAIGDVREAHVWTHRPVWDNQGVTEPLPPETAPEGLDWDRWIGSAPWRPYHHKLAPHDWRAWLDFGGGSLGDMACHIMDAPYWALKLVEATDFTVEVVMQKGRNEQTFPLMTTIKYSFPARAGMPAEAR